jgi:hypothetical protein
MSCGSDWSFASVLLHAADLSEMVLLDCKRTSEVDITLWLLSLITVLVLK